MGIRKDRTVLRGATDAEASKATSANPMATKAKGQGADALAPFEASSASGIPEDPL